MEVDIEIEHVFLSPRVMISILHYRQKQILKLHLREEQVLYFLNCAFALFFHYFFIANVSHCFSFFLSPGFIYQTKTKLVLYPTSLYLNFILVELEQLSLIAGERRMFSGTLLAVNWNRFYFGLRKALEIYSTILI